jgi:hypothetical protein
MSDESYGGDRATRDVVRAAAASPACGAARGRPCAGVRGRPRASLHRARWDAYRAAAEGVVDDEFMAIEAAWATAHR